jgi:dephospho-CoA kinase
MRRILLTGISGTGKSAVIVELLARGYKAVDVDNDEYSAWAAVVNDNDEYGSTVEPGRDWVWREDRIQELLSQEDADFLFLSGCAANMGQFLPQFDQVILLSAPKGIILERLKTRTSNVYGKQDEEARRVIELKGSVEPILREIAGYEIDTNQNMDTIVAHVVRIAQSSQS